MPHLETLGNVLTCGLAIVAIIVVPYKLARVWWPVVREQLSGLIMSPDGRDTPPPVDTKAVHVLVPGTDTSAGTTAATQDITDDPELPRVSTRSSDREITIYLAAQRGEHGDKYRFSANQIYELVKGPRAEVLATVREVREGPAEPGYPPTSHPLDTFAVVANGHDE